VSEPVLSIRDLSVSFPGAGGARVEAVRGLSLDLFGGTMSALVGESGSGKSVSAMSVLGLVPSPPALVSGGEISYRRENGDRIDLLSASRDEMRRVRGGEIAMVFQEPMTSLNPVQRIGAQIVEAVRLHRRVGRREAMGLAIALLERVGIADASRRVRQYPHEYSGGMRQRVMIAIALACRPRVLIADEPTTALDVTIQASILELIRGLVEDEGLSVLLITHDLALVRSYADRVAVMYRGVLLEEGACGRVVEDPAHPYTRGLLATAPDLDDRRERLATLDSVLQGAEGGMMVGGQRFEAWTPGGGSEASASNRVPGMVRLADGRAVRACSG
jgi:ABC-type dipeptide/oligopeptide/nickel transport system ATPase component